MKRKELKIKNINEIIDTKELCLKLKISRQSAYNYRKMGMPYIKVIGNIRYNFNDVIKWMEGIKNDNTPKN